MSFFKEGDKVEFIPVGQGLLLELAKTPEKTKGGIVLPENITSKPSWMGKIVGIGSDVEKDFKMGDIVIFDKYSGVEVRIPGKESKYVIMDERRIIAKAVLS